MKSRALFLLVSILALGVSPAFAADLGQELATRGVLLTLLSVFGAGVLVSLTPCVYPMIPITLSIIGARSIGQKPLTGFLRSLTFVLGIAVVYTAIGLIAASLGKGFQFILQNKAFWFILAGFFIAMGFSMMGAFNIQLPARFSGKLQGATTGKGGFVGAFLVGVVTGVAASPCGTPVLAGLMAYGAAKSNMPLVVTMFFTYSLGMGMLFLVLGTAPAFLKAMPKSGGWMEDVKKFLGIVLIGMGVYYLQFAFPRSAHLWYWILVVLAALAGGAIIALKATSRKDMPRMMLLERAIGAGLVLFAFYVAVAKVPSYIGGKTRTAQRQQAPPLTVEKLIAQARSVAMDEDKFTALAGPVSNPAQEATSTAEAGPAAAGAATPPQGLTDDWMTDEPLALTLAKENNLPVLIDFGADWCAVCKEIEHKVFPAPQVAEILKGFVKVRIDSTESDATNEALQKKYGAVSLPTVAFVDPNGKIREDLKLLTFESPDKFVERLKKVVQ